MVSSQILVLNARISHFFILFAIFILSFSFYTITIFYEGHKLWIFSVCIFFFVMLLSPLSYVHIFFSTHWRCPTATLWSSGTWLEYRSTYRLFLSSAFPGSNCDSTLKNTTVAHFSVLNKHDYLTINNVWRTVILLGLQSLIFPEQIFTRILHAIT